MKNGGNRMKHRKIGCVIFVFFLLLANSCYAKYSYHFEEVIVDFTRDKEPPVCKVSYSTEKPTNEKVTVTIEANKEVEQVSGFELSEDKKVLTKDVLVNEEKEMIIRDLSGNETQIEYKVNNIDKEPPQILDCKNGGTYRAPLKLEYLDNGEIESVKIDRYSYGLSIVGCRDTNDASKLTIYIDEHPLHTKKYRYYINDELYSTVTDLSYMFTSLKEDCEIKVEALDELGNVLDTAILEEIRNKYQEKNTPRNENELTEKGNYQVIATDTAGNMTVYYIKIQ